MDWLTTGADAGTMATGISALTAAYVWTRGRLRDWPQERAAIRLRNWHGYIMPNGIDD